MYLYVPPVDYIFTSFLDSSSTMGSIPCFEKTDISAEFILKSFIHSKVNKLINELS